MDNDQARLEVEEILRTIPPTPKKGDKISRRQIAESFARYLRGDLSNRGVSEEELQYALNWMDWNDEVRRVAPVEKLCWVTSILFFCMGIASLVIAAITDYKMFSSVVAIAVFFGLVFIAIGEWRRKKRISNLPPPARRL